jgi:hypothetical protein
VVETTKGRYESLTEPRLRARGFVGQQTEAAIGMAVLNRMFGAGGSQTPGGPARIELAPGPLTLAGELQDDRIDADLLGDWVDHGSRQNLADLQGAAAQVAVSANWTAKPRRLCERRCRLARTISQATQLPMSGIATQAQRMNYSIRTPRYLGNRGASSAPWALSAQQQIPRPAGPSA